MNVLFICPNWAGLATPIIEEMSRQGHHVTHLDHSDLSKFKYIDIYHRIMSKFYSKISGVNYKYKQTDIQIEQILTGFFIGRDKYDMVMMTEPNLFNRHHLEILKSNATVLVATLWDSLRKSPDNADNLDMFDFVFSYDYLDCEENGFIKINNYLDPKWHAFCDYDECKYDLFSIMHFTKARYQHVRKILDANPWLNPNIIFYCDHPRKIKYIKDHRIKATDRLILGEDLAHCISGSKGILDVLQGEQSGLSFRIYESIGYQRKLVTTNPHIKDYDIYNPNNIAIIRDGYSISSDFFNKPYEPIDNDVICKYTLEQWVKNIMSRVTY
ncbi:hypothetical protein [Vibrio gazogenes]|uniref:Uncharacterized protein n=1 Tax=Vibrio gazogenes TaxID=687 RepID=A0A1Z2SFL7_VIBGA|nr:hypothetical protein [Vibrio gazogenes]ASA55945.1 hypothetical protein BSQ33_09730 [Vibrio gazogenes]